MRRVFWIAVSLLLVLLVASAILLFANRPRTRSLSELVAAIEATGGTVVVEEGAPSFRLLQIIVTPSVREDDWIAVVEEGEPIQVSITGHTLDAYACDALASNTRLRELRIQNCGLEAANLALVATTGLNEVTFGRVTDIDGEVSEGFVSQLVHGICSNPTLKSLGFGDVPIGDDHLRQIAQNLCDLEELRFAKTDVTPAGIAALQTLPRLGSLTLDNIPMSFIDALSKCEELTSIRMTFDESDVAVPRALFEGIPSLRTIILDGVNGSDNSLETFREQGFQVERLNANTAVLIQVDGDPQ